MHHHPRLSLAAALAAGTLLTSCSSAVEVTAPPRADDPACERVAQHWPTTVAGTSSEETTSDSPAVHAWGDPAIIARCGVSTPGPTTNDCISANGVDWVARRLDDGMSFVTYGRSPAIEVLVPRDYTPEPLVLGAFSGAAKQVPQGPRRCS